MYALARPLLFRLDAEFAHDLTLSVLDASHRAGLLSAFVSRPPPLPVHALGLHFDNPLGLAAGLDKNGAHIDALAALGFGFIEIGTTTPRAQAGNPRPRMFRLPGKAAVINRLGFNNAGVDALLRNVERAKFAGVLGINIGKNKDTPNERAIDDYRYCLERVFARASYVTVNISSPNTQGLRDLQQEDALRRLLGELRESQESLAARHARRTPLLLKIAPDLDAAELDAIARALLDAGIDGVICTNTTLDRAGVGRAQFADESGGLSGQPLLTRSTAVLRGMRERVGTRLLLVGVGGVGGAADAVAKIDAGATLVQCYTGLIYRGPELIGECVDALRGQSRAMAP